MENSKMGKSRKNKETITNQRNNVSYLTQMLFDLKTKSDNIDKLLAHIIEMAAIHSDEIDTGRVKPLAIQNYSLCK